MKHQRQKTSSYNHRNNSGDGAGAVPLGSATGQGEQKEPVPLPPELSPVPAFNCDHIPEVFGDFARDLSVRMSAPPDFIAFTLLVCAGSVIGRRIGIRPQQHTSWTVVANLWLLAIGRAGFMKSPAMEAGMKFLERLAAAATRICEEKLAEYQLAETYAKIESEAAKKRVKDAITKGNGSVSPADLAVDEPEKPIHVRFITNDPTEPALLGVMRENMRGLLLYRDEPVGLWWWVKPVTWHEYPTQIQRG